MLVESWVLEDAATEQLMKHFFKHLDSEGSANESLHHGRKWLRNNGFTKTFQWAPFMLMGDNFTFDFEKLRKEKPTTMEKNEGDKEGSDKN